MLKDIYVQVEGKSFRILDKTPEVGDQVLILYSEECPEVIGKVGNVTEFPCLPTFNDFDIDVPSDVYGHSTYVDQRSDRYLTVEPIEQVEKAEVTSDTIQSQLDLIETIQQMDDKIEMLMDDVVMLDDRTQPGQLAETVLEQLSAKARVGERVGH